jgi:signal transduction histidine kinase
VAGVWAAPFGAGGPAASGGAGVRWFGVAGRVLPDAHASLWRAVAVYRVLVLGYAVVMVLGRWRGYAHPLVGGLVVAGMVLWTAVCTWAYSPARRGSVLILVADVAVACGAVLLTVLVETPEQLAAGVPTLPTLWASASILAWAVSLGVRGGVVAAGAVSAANLIIRPHPTSDTLANVFLLLLAGVVVGYVSTLVLAAQAERTRAVEFAAAAAERERLARGIHDSVLQVLALVQRRGREIGGEAAELGRLAGEQERMLRTLVTGEATPTGAAARASVGTGGDAGAADLGLLLRTAVARRPYATLAGPAPPVVLGGYEASEMAAAAAEALENVRRHAGAGARAWVLVEDEPAQITVTVRDDGAGMSDGRLTAASAEGRLGVAQSIVARMRTLGGDASITSKPGQGTEVELRLPKKPAAGEGRR